MDIEYSPHSPGADFWRNAYLKAMEVGHKDPAAVADAAFLDFESRFGVQVVVVEEIPKAYANYCAAGQQRSVLGGVQHAGLRIPDGAATAGIQFHALPDGEHTGTDDKLPTYDAEMLALVPKASVGKVDTSTSALAVDAAVGMLAQADIMVSDAERMRDVATGVLAAAQNSVLPGVTIGEGPSIEVGDAPQALEHGWKAGHVAPEEGDLG